MAWAGGGSDEYKVEAGQLNQSFVGLAFGYNVSEGRVTYGRLAGLAIRQASVILWLDGVQGDAGTIEVGPGTELWFSRYTANAQIAETLDRIERLLDPKARR